MGDDPLPLPDILQASQSSCRGVEEGQRWLVDENATPLWPVDENASESEVRWCC